MTPPDEATLAAIVAAFAQTLRGERSHDGTTEPAGSRWRAAGRRYDDFEPPPRPKRERA